MAILPDLRDFFLRLPMLDEVSWSLSFFGGAPSYDSFSFEGLFCFKFSHKPLYVLLFSRNGMFICPVLAPLFAFACFLIQSPVLDGDVDIDHNRGDPHGFYSCARRWDRVSNHPSSNYEI